jgi:hypothetical protein
MRFKLMSILVVGLLLVAAGCGGSSKKSAQGTTTAATTTEAAMTQTTATTTETAATETTSSIPAGKLNLSSKSCQQLLQMGTAFSQALSGTDQNKSLDALTKALQTYAKNAPSDIKSDFELYAQAFVKYAAALKSGDVSKMQQMASEFSGSKFQKASEHISAWAQTACTK